MNRTRRCDRLELLKTRLPILREAGQTQAARDDSAQLRTLGAEHNDFGSIALADIWAAGQQADADRPEEALTLLLAARNFADRSADPVCNWERTLQIADLALDLGKANGRNCAHGIGPLRVAPDKARR